MAAPARCPICAQPVRATNLRARDRMMTGEGPFTALECPDCRYALTLPQLDDAALARYYPREYYDFQGYSDRRAASLPYRLLGRFRSWSATRSYRRRPYVLDRASPGRMLDVGCGSGELLEDFATRGWQTYGIDPSSQAVLAAAARGANVHQGTLRDQPWAAGSFGLITFQHSLEHISDPVDALKRARALLEPGGLLIVSVPNWACWQRRYLFRGRWSALDMPRHQQHFSPRALERLAAVLGLHVRSVGTTSNVPVAAYSLHYALFGHLQPGWRLWLSYALGMLIFPFVLIGDRVGGGDACFIVMRAPSDPVAQSSGRSATRP